VLCDLISKSTAAVQARLLKHAPPERHEAIRATIERTATLACAKKPAPVDYSEAKSAVLALNNAGKLNDSTINRFAIRREQTNLVAALSLLATISTETVELLLQEDDYCGLMIACRASRLNWQTTTAIVSNRRNARPIPTQELAQHRDMFEALALSLAQRTIRFGSASEFTAKFGSTGQTQTGAD